MSKTDKSKLNLIEANATANSTDAQLRDRSTHTGTQIAATISDLGEAIYQAVASIFQQGANVTLTKDDTNNLITVNSTGGSGGGSLSDMDYGDVLVSGGGTAMTVQSAAGAFEVKGSLIDVTGSPGAAATIRHTGSAGGALVIENTGGTYGDSRLTLTNENGQNGAIFETTNAAITLTDFIFKTATGQNNIRYERRGGSVTSPNTWEFQFGVNAAAMPNTFIIGDAVNASLVAFRVPDDAYSASWNGSVETPTKNAVYDKMETKLDASQVGAANGVASLDATGKVPAAQLPSFVDDVLEYANLAGFPATGETGKIYIAQDTGWEYRWSGSLYTRIVASPGTTSDVPEGSNLYFTTARVLATALTGFSTTTNAAITATDTILVAIGKAQAQLNAHIGAGGAAHANVVAGGNAGFMTGADKTKLDGIAAGATANSADATLLNRANHTGSQAISTVTSLQSSLDAKAPAFTPVLTISASATLADATHNNAYLKLTGAASLTMTANNTTTAGFTCVVVNRGTVAMTLSFPSGVYKNGATATVTSISVAVGGKATIFHEGAGVYTADGGGLT
jgi:hypothetical protein